MRTSRIIISFIFTFLVAFTINLNCNAIGSVTAITTESIPFIHADPLIIIDEDSDFIGYPGYGNETHPYIIQGKNIQVAEMNAAILVANTTAHFVIRNNVLMEAKSGLGWGFGIYLQNVAPDTAKITNNELLSMGYHIYVKDSEGVIIEDNICRDSESRFITLISSPHTHIENNSFYATVAPSMKERTNLANIKFLSYEEHYVGIKVIESSDTNITNNYFNAELLDTFVLAGIRIDLSDRILINNNIIKNFKVVGAPAYEQYELSGIYLESSSYVIVFNNTMENNDKNNVWANGCNNLQILNNTLRISQVHGISLTCTNNVTIAYNTIQQHPSYGVSLDLTTTNTEVHHNHFIDNNVGGSQALDAGTNNVWYDTTLNEGNWWNNWIGGDYDIAGSAASVDPYPLGEPIVVPDLSTKIMFLILLLPISIASTLLLNRKTRN